MTRKLTLADIAAPGRVAEAARRRSLHPAERKYLLDAARGYTAAQTARRHAVSVHTVNTTLSHARGALGALNTTHAVALALAVGEFATDDLEEAVS